MKTFTINDHPGDLGAFLQSPDHVLKEGDLRAIEALQPGDEIILLVTLTREPTDREVMVYGFEENGPRGRTTYKVARIT